LSYKQENPFSLFFFRVGGGGGELVYVSIESNLNDKI